MQNAILLKYCLHIYLNAQNLKFLFKITKHFVDFIVSNFPIFCQKSRSFKSQDRLTKEQVVKRPVFRCFKNRLFDPENSTKKQPFGFRKID